MNLKQLEYFARVAELESFTKASHVLNIAQPALSRQIRLLEIELHENLLLRNGRGVTTTEAGKILLEHSRGILHQVARAKEDISKVRGSLSGGVALGLPPSMTKMITVPLSRAFQSGFPQARLSISEGLSITMQEWLLNGRLDIALLYHTNFSSDLEITPLLEEDLFFIQPITTASISGPTQLRDIVKLPLIMPIRPNALRMLVETESSKIGEKPNIVLEIDGISTILDLIEDGAGFGILPKYAIKASGKESHFQIRQITNLVGRLVIATSARRTSTRIQTEAIKMIQEVVQKISSLP
jgi:LysR family nitrogen assimilation transcriptional regulator